MTTCSHHSTMQSSVTIKQRKYQQQIKLHIALIILFNFDTIQFSKKYREILETITTTPAASSRSEIHTAGIFSRSIPIRYRCRSRGRECDTLPSVPSLIRSGEESGKKQETKYGSKTIIIIIEKKILWIEKKRKDCKIGNVGLIICNLNQATVYL